MSLWGCDFPLLALAPCHRRSMVCSRLSVQSFVLCAGLAVSQVRAGFSRGTYPTVWFASPNQFAQIALGAFRPDPNSKRCSPRHASLPSPRLLLAGAGIRAASPLGELPWAPNLWVLIVYLIFLPVMLPSVLPRLGTDSAVRVFPGVWKLLSF